MKTDQFNKFANSFQAVAKLRLESIRCLLNNLNNPQKDLNFIHVAGTNGKGSVCSFLQCIFTDSGKKTGKYISPNLISVCERISIDGKNISEKDLEYTLSKVQAAAEKVLAEQGDLPTQFEIWTAAAFCYFKEQSCDIVILETGLGGTRDATNIIPPPLASVITQLGLDHTEYLGNSIEEIAIEKAGIIKKPLFDKNIGITITAPQPSSAEEVLKAVCSKQNNRLVVSNSPTSISHRDFHEIFSYLGSTGEVFSELECGITGSYQPQNACLAIETALGLGVEKKHIINGIRIAKNPARFEIISKNPLVIYDGAHNKNGMSALVTALKRYLPKWNGANFIMAFMGDKDIEGALSELKNSGLSENSTFMAVQVKDNPRSAKPEEICSIAKKLSLTSVPYDSLSRAYSDALGENKPTIICGSLYLYKDLSEII